MKIFSGIGIILIAALVACNNVPIPKTVFFTPTSISLSIPISVPTIVPEFTSQPTLEYIPESTPNFISEVSPGFMYYSQRDPRWANINLTCTNGHKSYFINQGCGETVFAMLMSTFVDLKYTPKQVLKDFYGYSYCGGTFPTYSTDLLREQGFEIPLYSISADKQKEYIKQGWIAWIHVTYTENDKQIWHESIITGIDKDDNFVIADPFYGIGSLGTSQFPFDENDILEFYVIKPLVK